MKPPESSSRSAVSSPGSALAFADVDAAVEAFEDARAIDRTVSLRPFLPQHDAESYLETLQELVRVDLDHRFRETGSASLEDYRTDYSELFETPATIEPLAFEEYRLRLSSPEPVAADEYARRYRLDTSRWPKQGVKSTSGTGSPISTRASADSASSSIDAGSRVELSPGQRLLDFSIVGELGRGAFSRVYLAKQMSLSERPVVLKVSSVKLREAERLARLQHTNIVPVYSVHDYQKYSILCMPWFGSTTLKDVAKSLRSDSPLSSAESQLSGQMLLSTVMKCESQTLIDLGGAVADRRLVSGRSENAPAAHIRSPLAKMDLEHSAVWLTMKMAEGLAHAHARGILHRDLKPANVLLTEDGQPMILDFNLAVGQEDLTDAIAGGTLPYMSPEQIASVESYRTLDPASDVFSLGVMLYELVTGRLPFVVNSGTYRQMIEERWQNSPQARDANPRLSVDLNSIIAKCLQPDVAQRYATAADLAEDLDRHLRNLPLIHASNRSIPERMVKWVKRHPQVTSSTGIVAIALILVIALGMAWWRNDVRLMREMTERQAEEFIQKTPLLQGEAFEAVFGEASFADTRKLLKEAIAPFQSATAETGKFNVSLLQPEQRTQLNASMAEVDFLLEKFEGSSQSNLRSAVPFPVETMPEFRSDEERIRFGVSSLLHRDLEAAESVLSPVTEAHPNNFAASLLHGMILMEISHGGSLDGEALLSAAIAAKPNSVNAWYQRGLCRIALKKFEAAAGDFTRVLELNSSKLNALVSRAICFKSLGRYDVAIADLTKAIDGGFPETRTYFLRAAVYRMKGNTEAAEKDKATGLSLRPSDARSWVVRALEQLPGNAEAALADLREAQTLNPQSHEAFRNLAMVLSEYLKRPEDAIKVQTDALQTYSDDSYLWVGRAVLHARAGRREQAIQDAEAALERSKEPLVIYSAACVYALTSEKTPDDAAMGLKLLADSIRADNSLAGLAPTDQDLKSINARPEFRNILAAAQILNPPAPPKSAVPPQ